MKLEQEFITKLTKCCLYQTVFIIYQKLLLMFWSSSSTHTMILLICTCQESHYCFPLCHSTTEEIIPQNSRAHLAEDEKESKLKIKLNSNDICNYLFFHLFLKMNVLNQVSVPQQSENIKCSCRKMDVPVGGHVHLTKTNSSFTKISAALSRRSNSRHVFYRQDAGASLER